MHRILLRHTYVVIFLQLFSLIGSFHLIQLIVFNTADFLIIPLIFHSSSSIAIDLPIIQSISNNTFDLPTMQLVFRWYSRSSNTTIDQDTNVFSIHRAAWSQLKKDTKVGSQNFGYQIWFCTRLYRGASCSNFFIGQEDRHNNGFHWSSTVSPVEARGPADFPMSGQCIPEITRDFCGIQTHKGWSLFPMGAHDQFYFFHNVFSLW